MRTSRILIAAAFAALMLLGSGCKKHSFTGGAIQFTATSHAMATKTAYSDVVTGGVERIDWLENDKIAICMTNDGGSETGDFLISSASTSSEKSLAKLSPLGGPLGGNGLQWGEGAHSFIAIYPSPSVDDSWENELAENKLVLTYPAVQTLTPKGGSGADALTLLPDMKYAYMYATAQVDAPHETINLSFMPVFTAFEVVIGAGDNDAVNLTGFRLISNRDDQPLARVMDVFNDDSKDESLSVSVDLTGIRLVRGGDPLRLTVFAYADGFAELSLEFTGTEIGTRRLDLMKDGSWVDFDAAVKHKISGLSFPALDGGSACGQEINWNGTVGEDIYWNGAEGEDINFEKPVLLPGEFSISQWEQVNFSRGNIYYHGGQYFEFHKNQYDHLFEDNGIAPIGEEETFDLFGWATSHNISPWYFNDQVIPDKVGDNDYGYGPTKEEMKIDAFPVSAGFTLRDEPVYDLFTYDWGFDIDQDKYGHGWFTLSLAEWQYLLFTRDASTLNGVNNARFVKATVHGLPGLIIFSDFFGDDFEEDPGIFPADKINQAGSGAAYSDIVLTGKQWYYTEKAGAVFLGPTGYYQDGLQLTVKDADGYYNLYWTSTPYDSATARIIGCHGSEVFLSDVTRPRYYGCAVRLVKFAE